MQHGISSTASSCPPDRTVKLAPVGLVAQLVVRRIDLLRHVSGKLPFLLTEVVPAQLVRVEDADKAAVRAPDLILPRVAGDSKNSVAVKVAPL